MSIGPEVLELESFHFDDQLVATESHVEMLPTA